MIKQIWVIVLCLCAFRSIQQVQVTAQETIVDLVYVTENSEIIVSDSFGTPLETLNTEGLGPRLSPDGEQIAFFRTDENTDTSNIFVMDWLNGTEIQLTSDGLSSWPRWSPDGQQIAYVNSLEDPVALATGLFFGEQIDSGDVYVIDSNGGIARFLTTNQRSILPVWSPDGTTLAYTQINLNNTFSTDIYMVNVQTTNTERLTTSGRAMYPMWSPDGQRIAYTYADPVNLAWNIHVLDLQTMDDQALTFNNSSALAVWSPDGSRLAFIDVNIDMVIFNVAVMDNNGTATHQITQDDTEETINFLPSWSADGTKLAYTTVEGIQDLSIFRLYVYELETESRIRIDGAFMHDWLP
jgi:Tol biopolymer transport system component